MKNSGRKRNGWFLIGSMALLLSVCTMPLLSHADDDYWTGNVDSSWLNAGNWSLGQAPAAGDNVYLSPTNQNTVVVYDTSNNPTLGLVQVDGAGGYTMELQQSQGSLSSGSLNVGYNGTGIYTLTGGNINISAVRGSTLTLGYNTGSNGTFNLSGDPATSTILFGEEVIGLNGTGTFNQTGGSNTTPYLIVGANGTYNLSNTTGASVLTAANLVDNIYGTFNQTGGTFFVSGMCFLNISGTYNLSGDPNTSILNASYGSWENISGTFNQTGGTNLVGAFDYNGTPTSATDGGLDVSGTYNLSGDPSKSILKVTNEYIGSQGNTAIFNQSGGNHVVEGSLYIGGSNDVYHAPGNGTYNLSGDPSKSILTVTGNEYIGYNGYTGVFNQTGGAHTVSGTLNIGDNQASSLGIYNLSGGTLIVSGGITNNDTFNYSGGSLTANITNNGTTNLSGPGTRTVNGDVTNNGTFNVTNTIAQYTGTFTNNGAYVSDPAVNYFINLVIGQNGYLQGGKSDQFLISGYFQNMSTNSLWNTSNALLGFDGGGQHSLFETGTFHWGTLDIFEGNSISLSGSGSLYLEYLIGLAFNPCNDTISNIWGNGLNIYYDAADNPWLDGQTYSLMGGGDLIAYNTNPTAPVPEPSTMLLLGAGLIGLAGFRKKLKNR